MAWRMKIIYPGMAMYVTTDEEPKWRKEKNTGRVYLDLIVPEEDPGSYRDAFYGIGQRIYRDELHNWVGPFEHVQAGRSSSTGSLGVNLKTDPNYALARFLYAIDMSNSPNIGRVPTYGAITSLTGFGQKKNRDLFARSQARGYHVRVPNENGAGFIFRLTPEGLEKLDELTKKYDKELGDIQ